jgi:hypothetical protein
MQGELSRRNLVLGDGVVEQSLEQASAFSIGDAPADNPTAEDVDMTGIFPKFDAKLSIDIIKAVFRPD